LGDGAHAISAAASEVFPNARRLMCWAHVFRKIQARLNSFSEDIRRRVLDDLCMLQLAINELEFDRATKFLGHKWPQIFFSYFFETWINSGLKFFFEGASSHLSTNNGLESTNKQIKKVHMLYKRAPLSKFFEKALDIVDHWTKTVKVCICSN
jgi:transposase-like protein